MADRRKLEGLVAIGAALALALGLWLRSPEAAPQRPPARHPEPRTLERPAPREPVVAPAVVVPPAPDTLADRARSLAGAAGVVCRVDPPVDGGAARLELHGDPGEWLAAAAVAGDVLVLSSVPAEGAGTLRAEGFAPVEVRWADARQGQGRCETDPVVLVPAEAAVVGVVSGARGVTVTACGQPAVLGADGGFFASATPGEPCAVEARRHFGVWEWSERLEVTPRQGADEVVEIEAPAFDAVLPVVIEGGAVVEVWDEAADVPAGARVVAVDGQAVPADADGFHLATGGEVDSEATLLVEDGGERFELTLRRRALSFEDWLVR